ncbi:uncharacterized protein LOC143895385 isoform X1 [Temnothorax americanus]|uniref:uncharacterized protein LOC143895385 isoform X1 n=1 Tax=Temnothorax americanus TaxID=1964332 RepID=UPI0040683297
MYDAETQEYFTLQLTPVDALKARRDKAFARQLIKHARELKNDEDIVIVSDIDDVVPDDTVPDDTVPDNTVPDDTVPDDNDVFQDSVPDDSISGLDTVSNEEVSENFIWSHEAILLLLEEYRQQEQDMYLGKVRHKKIWEQIAQILTKKGYMVSGRQCCTRVNTMKRTYKSVKDFNKKSGNGRREWKYLDLMESLLEDKPYMEPLSTLSSTGAETIKTENPNSSHNLNILGKSFNVNISVPCKRKANDVSQKIDDEQKEKRHKEKMEVKHKLLKKLDKLIDKL